MTPHHAVSLRRLSKSYGDHTVLDGLDLDVDAGTVFALLGPNGAGKTTMVQILSTSVRPDEGEVRVMGHDLAREPDAVRAVVGVTGQFSAVDGLLTGRENLRLMADLHHLGRGEGRQRVSELLALFALTDAADKAASTYSGGMRRRLDLAMTLVGRPRLVFLDEPTTGLDPLSRRALWQVIRDLVADGLTVFLTTQYLEEADQLADRVAVLDRGRLVADGAPETLKRSVPGGHVRLTFDTADALDAAAASLDSAAGTVVLDPDTLALQVAGDGSVDALRGLLDRLAADRVDVARMTVHTPDLDDVFLALTGHATHDAAPRQTENAR